MNKIIKKLLSFVVLLIVISAQPAVYAFEEITEAETEFPNPDIAKFAFIMGNQNYHDDNLDLANPVNDADAMNEKLQLLGFDTIVLRNAFKRHFTVRFKEFVKKVRKAKREDKKVVTLFFYAGHGIQYDTINYLVPIETELMQLDRDITGADIRDNFISLKQVTNRLATLESLSNIIILDACRDLPIAELSGRTGGWADVVEKDFFVAFGTGPGAKALDGEVSAQGNGLYTAAIIEHIETKGLNLSQLFQNVRKDVIDASNGLQIPQESSRATNDFYFVPGKRISYLWQLFIIAALVLGGSAWFIFYHKKQKVAWVTGIDLTAHIMQDKPEVEEMVSRSRLQKNITGYVKDLKRKKIICLMYDKPLTIGRDPSCNIHLPDDEKYLSRFHCDLGWDSESQKFWIEEPSDRASGNGTFSGAAAEKGEGEDDNIGKLVAGERHYLEPGEVFYLADPNEKGWPMTIIKHKSD
jgi:hypothetical protein